MNTFDFSVSTPDGCLFRGEVFSVSLRGANGDLAVLSGHIPFITTVKPCKCKIILPDGTEKFFNTESGILTVKKEKTTLLSGSIIEA